METVKVTIEGTMPFLMHADNIDWADYMDEWRNDPANKAVSKAGDDRTPPWRWMGCLNYDDPKAGVITLPAEYLMRSIMDGAAQVPTGKGKKTFKSQSQSGLLCSSFHFPFLVDEKQVSMKSINELKKLKTFKDHCAAVEDMGFSLFVKRAKIGASKHIRVRPRFDKWSASGELVITDEQITKRVLQQILDISGRLKGMGDWRPGSSTPGPFGMYTATVE